MGFFDYLQEKAAEKYKVIARQAPDANIVREILRLQQKIEDGEGNPDCELQLEILKKEADRRRLYY